MTNYEIAKSWIKESKYLVFFGGAGVSTQSGIPDFRSQNGLFNDKNAEDIVSNSFFNKHTKEFFEFYKTKMVYLDAKPNDAHKILAKWEKEKKLKSIITQNIDGLHQMAGSSNVIELHGSIHRNYCINCNKSYNLNQIMKNKEIPYCDDCGNIIKPDVVLYEEALDYTNIIRCINEIEKADTIIVAGTSLNVYPAASFLTAYRGRRLIIVNSTKTNGDDYADLIINDKIANFLNYVDK